MELFDTHFDDTTAYHCGMARMNLGESHSSRMPRRGTECFERRQLSALPLALGAVNRNLEKHLFSVHVYCVCQLPESYWATQI